jgi:hypothetical protein
MTVNVSRRTARFRGICGIEEAEPLLDWLRDGYGRRADLSACEHLHTALLQILLAHRVQVMALPPDPWLGLCLAPLQRPQPAALNA